MTIVSIGLIVEFNKLLEAQGIPGKLHLRDACGGQSMWLELFEDGEPQREKAAGLLETFFTAQGITVERNDEYYRIQR